VSVTDQSDARAGVHPYTDFSEASQGAVEFLHERIGLDLWLVTRVEDDRQVAVVAHPRQVVEPGMAIPWAEGFCSRMVEGKGPRIASVTAAVPAYAGLSFGPAKRVSAYVGVPLLRDDGALFGTLCGFGMRAQPPSLNRHLPLVEHTARMLSTVLAQEGAAVARQHRIEQVLAESERDALTGLLNRRGWERAMEVEEARCRRQGVEATVVVLDLDELKSVNDAAGHAAGDDYLRRVAQVLVDNSRPIDVVARTGGDEFAVLIARPTGDGDAESHSNIAYLERLSGQLAAAECAASVGMARRRDSDGIFGAWQRADAAMYEAKGGRRGRGAAVEDADSRLP
jgi:diguanylate cyclase